MEVDFNVNFNVSFNIFLEHSSCAFSRRNKRLDNIKMHSATVKIIRHLVQAKVINASSQLSYLTKVTLQKLGAAHEGTECIRAGECNF